MSKFLTLDDFREKLVTQEDVGDASILQVSVCEPKAVANAERSLRFVFSDGTVDRVGDTIDPKGWELTDYMRNSVILWAHDSEQPPIGRASNITATNGKLMGDVEFMTADLSPFSDTVFQMVKGGWIKACSVGFRPLKYAFASPGQGGDRPAWGIDFKQQELLEVSICPVPCNANALVAAKAAGIDVGLIRQWAEEVLDRPDSVAVPRAELIEWWKAAKTPKAIRQKYASAKPPKKEDALETGDGDEQEIQTKVGGNCGRSKAIACGMKSVEDCAVHNGDAAPASAPTCGLSSDQPCGMKNAGECIQHKEAHILAKAGRRISAATKALMQQAIDYHQKGVDCLNKAMANDAADADGDNDGDTTTDGSGKTSEDISHSADTLTEEQQREKRKQEAAALRLRVLS